MPVDPRAVFLNIPYDQAFENLYLAYIAGLSAFNLDPRATLAIAGARRLDRIAELLESCAFSIHDLSRVQIARDSRVPRFNMPFELGLAVQHARTTPQHRWFVFEALEYRIQSSCSDLNGTDPYIHEGTVEGLLSQIANAFVHKRIQPTVPNMLAIYRQLRRAVPAIQRNAGSKNLFTARAFSDLSLSAAEFSKTILR